MTIADAMLNAMTHAAVATVTEGVRRNTRSGILI